MKNVKLILSTIVWLSVSLSSAYSQEGRSGFFNSTKVGFIDVLSADYGGAFLTTVNGWHFTENISAGVGLSVQGYRDAPTFYPISAQGYYFIKKAISSPYVYVDLGYSLTFEELYRGSLSYGLGLGWQFKIGGISLGPEIGFRRVRWQARTGEVGEGPNGPAIEYTGYTSQFLRQINYGVSLFFEPRFGLRLATR